MSYNDIQDKVSEFENLIKSFISLNVKGDETYVNGVDAFQQARRENYIPDLVLPKGCKALNIPQNSVIEIKYFVRFDTFQRIYRMYERSAFKSKYPCFIFIYRNSPNVLLPQIRDEHMKTYTEEEFFHLTPKKLKKKELYNQNEKFLRRTYKVKDYRNAFNEGNCTLFIGAGVSMSAKLPGWDKLLFNMGKKIYVGETFGCNDKYALEKAFRNSSLVEARYLKTQFIRMLQNATTSDESIEFEKKYKELVKNSLYESYNSDSSDLIETIACVATHKSRVRRIITYNFDDLLEKAISEKEVEVQHIFDRNRRLEENSLPILYVHGIIPQNKYLGTEMVLSEDDYHKLYNQPYSWANVEQVHALQSSTCFFIGMSMSDPNLRRLLEVARISKDVEDMHYAFLPRSDFFNTCSSYPKEDVVEEMFYELGVHIEWYKESKDLLDLLNSLIDK